MSPFCSEALNYTILKILAHERTGRRLLFPAQRQAPEQLSQVLGGALWYGPLFTHEPCRNDPIGLGQL